MDEHEKNINQLENAETQFNPREYFSRINEKSKALPFIISTEIIEWIFGMQSVESSDKYSGWNNPRNYSALFQHLLLHIPRLSTDNIRELKTKISENDNNAMVEYKKVDAGYFNFDCRKAFIQSVIDNGYCKDLKLTEIGGTVMKPLAEKLGFSAQDDGDNTISLDNWKKYLQKDQDIVATSRVFDYGSGIREIAKPKHDEASLMFLPEELGALELLMVIYNISKMGGVSLNDEFFCDLGNKVGSDISKEAILKMIGWEICPNELRPYNTNTTGFITTMVKTKPQTDKIELGLKTAIYNEAEDIWQIQ